MVRKTRMNTLASEVISSEASISTSEGVKTRTCIRKRKATSTSCIGSPTSLETSSREHDAEPQTYQPMALAHLDELAKIWDADKRIPSVFSRRVWALARNLKPEQVHRWWYRRKKVAKKARITIPKGSYELPVGTPPIIDQVVKEEPDAPKFGKMPKISHRTGDPWGSSNPASTIIDPIRPSSGGFEPSSPSDAATGRLRSSQSHQHYSAYSPFRPLPALFLDHGITSKLLGPLDQTLSSSPLPSSSPVSASLESCASRQTASVIGDRIAGSTQPICNQGVSEMSCYTCPLCPSTASSSGLTASSTDSGSSHSTSHTQDYSTELFSVARHSTPAYTIPSSPPTEPLNSLSFPFTQLVDLVSCSSSPSTLSDPYTHVYKDSTWCFSGKKYSYDGFLIGGCTCIGEDGRM